MRGTDRAATGVVVLAMGLALALLGGTLHWAVAVVAAVVAVGVGATAKSKRSVPSGPALWLVGVALGATALQLIPLPLGVVEVLAPYTAELAAECASSTKSIASQWLVLSADPPGTRLEFVKLLVAFGFVLLALRASANQLGRRRILQFIAVAGAALAITGIVHRALGAQTLVGIYVPGTYVPKLVAPLLNPNHLAAVLAAAACVALGLGLDGRGGENRVIWLGCACLCGATAVYAGSRGGLLALGIGGAMTIALHVRVRRRERGTSAPKQRGAVIAGAIVTAAISLAVVWAPLMETLRGFASGQKYGSYHKLGVWREALELVANAPAVGIGRGAFEPVFTRIHPSSHQRIYSHAENEYLQAVIDWGIPVALALALLVGLVALRVHARGVRSSAAAGAAGGLIALAVHNVADFSFYLPGVALMALALTAVLLRPRMGKATPGHRVGTWLLCGTLVVTAAFAVSPWGHSLREYRQGVDERVGEATPLALTEIANNVCRHPADFYAPARLANVYYERGSAVGFAHLARALWLFPNHPGLHHLAARYLRRFGRNEQALVEYRLAVRFGAAPGIVFREVLSHYSRADHVLRAMPRNGPGIAAVWRMVESRRPGVALLYGRELFEQKKLPKALLRRTARLAIAQQDAEFAVELAADLHRHEKSYDSAIAYAEALDAAGRGTESEQILYQALEGPGTGDDRARIQLSLARRSLAAGDLDSAAVRGREALVLASSRGVKASIHRMLSEIEAVRGNRNKAEWERARAREFGSPGD